MTEQKIIKKMFFSFLVPSLLASCGLALANIADALVLGLRLGQTALAAISVITPIYMVYNLLAYGLGIGGCVTYAKLLGDGNPHEAVERFNTTLQATLVLGVITAVLGNLFLDPLLRVLGGSGEVLVYARQYAKLLLTAAPLFLLNIILYQYIRNDDGEKLATVGFVVGSALDVILNVVLVLVLGYGVSGAIWSTVIAQAVSLSIYLIHPLKKSSILSFRLTRPRPGRTLSEFRLGLSTALQYGFQFFFILLGNRLLFHMGGDTALAVFDVVLNVHAVCLCLFDAMNATVQPLSTTFLHEHNENCYHHLIHLSYRHGLVLNGALTIALVIFAAGVCRFFGLTGASVEMGASALRIYAVGILAAGGTSLAGTILQTTGQGRLTYLMTVLRTCLIPLPLMLLFSIFKLNFFWWFWPAAELLTLGIFALGALWQRRRETPSLFPVGSAWTCLLLKQEDLGGALAGITDFCELRKATPKQTYFVAMAVEEICCIIIAQAFTPASVTRYIQLTVVAEEHGEFSLHLRDNATSFNPFSLPTDKVDKSEDSLDNLGVLMVKKKSKDFFYRRFLGFNTLVVKI